MTARRQQTKSPTTDPNLHDELLSLKRENARLKELLDQHGLLNRLNPESNQNGSNSSPKIASRGDTTQVTPRRKTGCSCQGKCATRVCGCVKRQIPCGESCRCADDQCQNQEHDKENRGERENEAVSEAGQENLRKLANLSIKDRRESNQGKSGRSDRRVENRRKKPGLFSPLSSSASSNLRIQESEAEPLTFGSDQGREIITTNDDEVFESRDAEENRNKSKTAGRVPGRSRRQNLTRVQPEESSRSASSGRQEDEPSAQTKKGPNRRTTSLGESSNAKAPKGKNNKTLAAVLNGAKPLRRAAAAKLGEASSENIEDPEANNKKVEEVNKKAKKTAKEKSSKKGNSNAKPMDEQQAEVNELLEEVANNIQLVAAQQSMEVELENEKTPPRPAEDVKSEMETHSIENIVNENIKTEQTEIDFIPFEDSARHEQSPSNSWSSSSPPFDQLQIDDPNFDPMKPRHNLTRSPLGPHTQSRTFLDVSERPLVPPMEEAAEELPPPEELNNIIVDWDKHQQERVYCSKCNRGFYPYRIKKHEASCKKV